MTARRVPTSDGWAGMAPAYGPVWAAGVGYVAAAATAPDGGGVALRAGSSTAGLPDDETHVVWRGETCFAILNAYPYTSGHLMVMPYREVADLEDLDADESAELWAAVRDAVVAIKAAYRPEGVNVGAQPGRGGRRGRPGHLHVHVLPRWYADTNFMTAVAETRVLPESLGDTWAKLRAAWPREGSRRRSGVATVAGAMADDPLQTAATRPGRDPDDPAAADDADGAASDARSTTQG